jgi:hypothetical protein
LAIAAQVINLPHTLKLTHYRTLRLWDEDRLPY